MGAELIASLVVFGIPTLVGAWLTVSAFRDIVAGHASRRWPTTRARVLSVGYHLGTRYHGDTSADIRYEYMVADQRYESNRYAFSGRGTGSSHYKVSSKYNVGDLVPVYFDPKRPKVACLNPGAGFPNYLMLTFGLLLLTPAVWVTLTVATS